VTLTGPGGIGKTTLALQVAQSVFMSRQIDAFLVDLASLSDPRLVPSAVAGVLDVRMSNEESDAASVARAIAVVCPSSRPVARIYASSANTSIGSALLASRPNKIWNQTLFSRRARYSSSLPDSIRPKLPFRPTQRTSFKLRRCVDDSMVFRSRSNLLQRAPLRLASPGWRPGWVIVLSC
jgi:hypothetical protein